MKPETQLALQESQLAAPDQPSFGSLLSIIERASKDPSVDIDKMERLLAMAERMEERGAVQAFNSAFAKLQRELPVIVAESVIPNRGKYARFENVMHQIQEHLTNNGFSVSFAQEADDKRIKVTCHLRHVGGHSQATAFAVRLGGKADSETQADCKASTTAKRNALLQALNIVIRQDFLQDEDECHNEGGEFITQAEADTLRDWVESVGADRIAFLEYAGATKFEEIRASRLESLHAALRKKEKEARR
jgi:hypothetical protein